MSLWLHAQGMYLLKEFYKQYSLLHSRDIAGSHLRALSNIPYCCLPWEPGPCLSPSVADHPLRSTKDPRLGMAFPFQLSNLVQAHPRTTHWSFTLNTSLHRNQSAKYFMNNVRWKISLHARVDSHMLRTRSPRLHHTNVRLACIKPIASVHSEPGSNSYVMF